MEVVSIDSENLQILGKVVGGYIVIRIDTWVDKIFEKSFYWVCPYCHRKTTIVPATS